MSHRVVFAPEAEEQLDKLYSYIAAAATAEVADDYVGRVIDRCEGLAVFPMTGMARDDIRPGVRTISYRKRTVIAFAVVDDLPGDHAAMPADWADVRCRRNVMRRRQCAGQSYESARADS